MQEPENYQDAETSEESSIPTEEVKVFIDDMFACYISQSDYDGWVGSIREKHFRIYQFIRDRLNPRGQKSTVIVPMMHQ